MPRHSPCALLRLTSSSKQTPLIPFPSAPFGSVENFISLCCFSSPNMTRFAGLLFGVVVLPTYKLCRKIHLWFLFFKNYAGSIRSFSLAEIVFNYPKLKCFLTVAFSLLVSSSFYVQFSRYILELLESSLKSPIGDFNQPSREGIIFKLVCEKRCTL